MQGYFNIRKAMELAILTDKKEKRNCKKKKKEKEKNREREEND